MAYCGYEEYQKESEQENRCPECGSLLDKFGEGDVCCYYSCDECDTCKGRTCDQSC